MKKKAAKQAASASIWESPGIKKIMSNPGRRAGIEAKYQYLEFLEDIEKLRKEKGISQNVLSKMTEISQEELSRIEHGKRNITFETYFRILHSLGYRPEIKYHKIKQAHAS
jgi:ribosome-binding protein aMBF1 (putative translation factor)